MRDTEGPGSRWTNPLRDGGDFRWDVLVAVGSRPPAVLDAVLGSIDVRQANTVVQVDAPSGSPARTAGPNLALVLAVPLPDLLVGMDVAVVSGDPLAVLAALRAAVPVVVLPGTAAQAAVGRTVAAAGLGALVDSAAAVGDAVRTTALDPVTTRRVRAVAARLAGTDVLLAALAVPLFAPASCRPSR